MSSGDNNIIGEIKRRINLSDIVKRKVSLQTKAPGEFTGLCPFHKEKSPSFVVSDNKAFYHCFGCSVSGDVFKFIMETEGLNFVEALAQLASIAGVVVPKNTNYDKEQRQIVNQKYQEIYAILEEACNYFQHNLLLNNGKQAQEYLLSRGFSLEFCKDKRLGFSLEQWHGLHSYLKQKKFSDQSILEAGLIVKNDKGEVYDRFRGRVMFPIFDINNKVVAFGGRIITKGEPKYLNSPETELFKKGRLLYNYNVAKKYAHLEKSVIVTEGYVDTLAMASKGINNCVASLGTAITPEQIQLLWRLNENPIICLDGDDAGLRAMEKVAHVAIPLLKPGYSLTFARLPEKMDPDDVIKKHGVDAIKKIIFNPQPLSEMLWFSECNKLNIAIPEQKAELQKRLNNIVANIGDKSVANNYKQFFNDKLWEYSRKAKYTKQSPRLSKVMNINNNEDEEIGINTISGCETILTMMIFYNPSLLKCTDVHEEWINIEFASNKLDKIRSNILEIAACYDNLDVCDLDGKLSKILESEDLQYLDKLKMRSLVKVESSSDIVYENWKYMFSRYQLAVLKQEYIDTLKQMTEIAMQRAVHIREQIAYLEDFVMKKELSLGDS